MHMQSSGFERPATGAGLFVSMAWLVGLMPNLCGCTELNPHYDPDGGPLCLPGERRCAAPDRVEVCTQDATAFETVRTCFGGSHCDDGLCLPDVPPFPCDRGSDCELASSVCTVAVDPAQVSRLDTFCLPAPFPGGRLGGQACTGHDQCLSGWCFRSLCFEACGDAADCTNEQHLCRTFDVTVDGVRDSRSITGCAP